MASPQSPKSRVTVDGKFFRLGKKKFILKGITYGPFAPDAQTGPFASPERTAKDFTLIRELGANLVRVYYVPPKWFLDLAEEHSLKVLIDIPWPKHLCFLDSFETQEEARRTVRQAVTDCKGHPAVFAFSVVNEIPAEIVRWSGISKVADFIDSLVDEAKAIDPECLCTFASFPPTEFLTPRNIDFVCFNVYLHQQRPFQAYLARLQMLADAKPLVLGEFGVDSIRETEENQAQRLAWQIEGAFRRGLAGAVVYSFTDDWFRGGRQIEDWAFGLTTKDRTPKKSFWAVQQKFKAGPYFPLTRYPKVSVVVASYNGARTLDSCLLSLQELNYPDYEVILVDDGSTDNTQDIAKNYPKVKNIRQTNHGLSVARNVGIAAATGDVVAFTDSDCRVDEDWLYYIIGDLLNNFCVGVGGHNFLPPEDSPVAAAVLVSPGGPAHVMIDDHEAEHIPGCNMAFYKWALNEIGGFDPIFRKAGDDVDVCWRLQERGYKICFSPAGFVWHYRRSTVKAYLKQQEGYGEAEALLARKHPEYFNVFGGGIWRGRIYTASKWGVVLRRQVIYHGKFGSGFFQKLYAPAPAYALMLCTSLEYQVLINLSLLILTISLPVFLPAFIVSFCLGLGICITASLQADLPAKKQRIWSRPLIAYLFFLQPVVRGWARYNTQLHLRVRSKPSPKEENIIETFETQTDGNICFWSKQGVDRFTFLSTILSNLESNGWQTRLDSGWETHDAEIFRNNLVNLRLTTVSEYLSEGRIFLRCRLAVRWSILSHILFWSASVLAILLIGYLAAVQPWIWMVLTPLPILAWFLEDEVRYQKELSLNSIHQAAESLRLQKYEVSKDASLQTDTPIAAEIELAPR
jgi:O-antigen biosynthesis protein